MIPLYKMKKESIIFISSDHAGFSIKEKIVSYLKNNSNYIKDLGPFSLDPLDDYPDFALKVAKNVSLTKNSLGILICGSGVGMAIVANKISNCRAVAPCNTQIAKISRQHNNANILCLPGKGLPFSTIKKILDIWLKTPFSNEIRHIRRLKKIEEIEKQR
jgi:RpiB/LacA/LacB family sugar-phosphate isomerase